MADDEGGARPGAPDGVPEGMPRWVKVFAAVALVLAAVVVVAKLAGGDHGPGRHGLGPVAAAR